MMLALQLDPVLAWRSAVDSQHHAFDWARLRACSVMRLLTMAWL